MEDMPRQGIPHPKIASALASGQEITPRRHSEIRNVVLFGCQSSDLITVPRPDEERAVVERGQQSLPVWREVHLARSLRLRVDGHQRFAGRVAEMHAALRCGHCETCAVRRPGHTSAMVSGKPAGRESPSVSKPLMPSSCLRSTRSQMRTDPSLDVDTSRSLAGEKTRLWMSSVWPSKTASWRTRTGSSFQYWPRCASADALPFAVRWMLLGQ